MLKFKYNYFEGGENMGDAIKKVFYVIVAIGLCAIIGTFIVKPIVTQVKGQQTQIQNINFDKYTQ